MGATKRKKIFKRVKVNFETPCWEPLDGWLDKVAEAKAQALADVPEPIYFDHEVAIDSETVGGYCDDTTIELRIIVTCHRWETPEETEKRAKRSELAKKSALKRKMNKEEKERAEYERLKAKFHKSPIKEDLEEAINAWNER